MIIHWRTIVVTSILVLSVIFFVRVLVILLLQLLFQLMVLLSEPFNHYGKALHLPLRWQWPLIVLGLYKFLSLRWQYGLSFVISHKRHQLMMCENCQWVVGSKSLQWVPVNKNKWPNRRDRCGTREKPSECQVSKWEISINSLVRELGIFCVPEKSGGLVLI